MKKYGPHGPEGIAHDEMESLLDSVPGRDPRWREKVLSWIFPGLFAAALGYGLHVTTAAGDQRIDERVQKYAASHEAVNQIAEQIKHTATKESIEDINRRLDAQQAALDRMETYLITRGVK